MHIEKIKNKGQGRLFKSQYVEMMTKTHPSVIYSLYLPTIIFLLYYGHSYRDLPIITEVIIFIGGIFFWSLFEYMMHRYLFHLIADNPTMQRILYTMHGVHHEFPRDKERLFMPPLPSILVAIIVYSCMYFTMGHFAMAFFPGFLFGYLAYGSMHYAIHAFAPPKYLKALWRNHHLHHYKTPDKGFGVSSVLWDVVFGTVPDKNMH